MDKSQIANLATDELMALEEMHTKALSRGSFESYEAQDISMELGLIKRELRRRPH